MPTPLKAEVHLSIILFPNSGAALSGETCSASHRVTTIWEITIVQETTCPGKDIITPVFEADHSPGRSILWEELFLSGIPNWRMKAVLAELCHLPLSSNREGFSFEGCRHQACWHTCDAVWNQRHRSYEKKASKRSGTDQATISPGNSAPFTQDAAIDLPRVPFREGQGI